MDIDDIVLKPNPVAEPLIRDRAPTHSRGERFLRGPIPWWWLSAAAIASGRGSSFKVAVAIWHLSGLNGQRKTIRLSGRALRDLGVSRYSAYRGLTCLEEAGLLKVRRHLGRCPIVTLLDREQSR